jgi:hypothetical protein
MPTFTHKAYEAIASTIKEQGAKTLLFDDDTRQARRALERLACDLSDMFAEDNPLFVESRFMEACGFEREQS